MTVTVRGAVSRVPGRGGAIAVTALPPLVPGAVLHARADGAAPAAGAPLRSRASSGARPGGGHAQGRTSPTRRSVDHRDCPARAGEHGATDEPCGRLRVPLARVTPPPPARVLVGGLAFTIAFGVLVVGAFHGIHSGRAAIGRKASPRSSAARSPALRLRGPRRPGAADGRTATRPAAGAWKARLTGGSPFPPPPSRARSPTSPASST